MVEFTSKSAAAYTQLAKTTLQLAHVSELLRLFQQAGLPLILLKGIALLERVYPAAEQRPMQDIDVLVRRADFERAAALLQTHGYRFSNKASLWNEAFAREFMGNVAYSKAGVAFDVHWHPVTMSWFRAAAAFDLDGLWARAVPAEIAGARAAPLPGRRSPPPVLSHRRPPRPGASARHRAIQKWRRPPRRLARGARQSRLVRPGRTRPRVAGQRGGVGGAQGGKGQGARGKGQDARGKGQDARGKEQ